jgi:hypothetical protein
MRHALKLMESLNVVESRKLWECRWDSRSPSDLTAAYVN